MGWAHFLEALLIRKRESAMPRTEKKHHDQKAAVIVCLAQTCGKR